MLWKVGRALQSLINVSAVSDQSYVNEVFVIVDGIDDAVVSGSNSANAFGVTTEDLTIWRPWCFFETAYFFDNSF